jgi:hypothetical protein
MEDSLYAVLAGINEPPFLPLVQTAAPGTACYAYLIINFAFYMDLSPPFHSGTAALRRVRWAEIQI